MPRKPYNNRFDKNKFWYRRNEQIRLSPVRVIDDDGTQLGVIPTEKALYIAREKELDLIEVAPNVRPPVCKIMEWSRFKYELSKKQKGQKKKEKMKEMQFKALIGKGDLEHKLKKVTEFLAEGDMVKVVVRTPKRVEVQRSEELMNEIMSLIRDEIEISYIQSPRREGFYVNSVIKAEGNLKKGNKHAKDENKQNSAEEVQKDRDREVDSPGERVEPPSKQEGKKGKAEEKNNPDTK